MKDLFLFFYLFPSDSGTCSTAGTSVSSGSSSDPNAAAAAAAAAAKHQPPEWQTLPSYMAETCRLGDSHPGSQSPPPPAPPDPPGSSSSGAFHRVRKASETENMDTLSPT